MKKDKRKDRKELEEKAEQLAQKLLEKEAHIEFEQVEDEVQNQEIETNVSFENVDEKEEVTEVEQVFANFNSQELKQYCDFIEVQKSMIDSISARIAGSSGERRAATLLRDNQKQALSSTTRLEPFKSQRARGRGSLFSLGIAYAVCIVLFIISIFTDGLFGKIVSALVGVLMFFSLLVFLSLAGGYSWFSFLYPKRISYNVVSEIKAERESNKTLVILSNYDSPYGLNVQLKKNLSNIIMVSSILSIVLFLALISIKGSLMPLNNVLKGVFCFLAVLFVFFSAVMILSYTSSKAKIKDNNCYGAMIALGALKYIVDNKKLPDDVTVVFACLGAGYAGHGGAEAFLAKHKKTGLFDNAVVLNFGEVKDSNLTVVSKDFFRFQKYDEGLVAKCIETAGENNQIIDEYSGFLNSPFGFASSTFSKENISTASLLSADMSHNPLKHDIAESIDKKTIENGFVFAASLIDKVLGDLYGSGGKEQAE